MTVMITVLGGSFCSPAFETIRNTPPRVRGLLRKNHVAELILDYNPRQGGCTAEYCDEDGDRMFLQRFHEDDTAEYVARKIKELLTETIPVARERRRAELEAEARAAGFSCREEMLEAAARQEAARRAEARKEWEARVQDPDLALGAELKLQAMIAAHPEAVRLGRHGQLVRADDTSITGEQLDRTAIIAWLVQHGHRPTIDDRHHLFAAAKERVIG